MSNLTDREKQELSEAIDKITDLCSDGLSPNDAIIKTAQDMRLGADRLPILVSAYNIGATADQWHSGESIREKTASFQIADIDAIKRKLYPTAVKTASYRQKMDSYVDNSFSFSPDTLFDDPLECYRTQPLLSVKKAARLPKEDKVYPGIREAAYRLEKHANENATRTMVRLENAMSKLASVVSDKRSQEYNVFKTAAKMALGKRGVSIMQSLEEMYPSVKKAKYRPSQDPIHRTSPFFNLLNEVSSAIDSSVKANVEQQRALQKVASAREQVESHWRRAIHGTELQQLFLDPIMVQALDERDRKAMRKKADSLDDDRNLSRLESLNNPSWVGVTNREYGILSALNDAKHRSRIRNIVTESMLTDLINTDPTLKTYDPEAVLDAYDDILEVAPHMVGKKMLLREALREYLSSESLDMATLGQLTQMEDRWNTAQESKRKNLADSGARITAIMDKRKEQRQPVEGPKVYNTFNMPGANSSRKKNDKEKSKVRNQKSEGNQTKDTGSQNNTQTGSGTQRGGTGGSGRGGGNQPRHHRGRGGSGRQNQTRQQQTTTTTQQTNQQQQPFNPQAFGPTVSGIGASNSNTWTQNTNQNQDPNIATS